MHFSLPNTLLLALLQTSVLAASPEKKIVEPCTIGTPGGNFYDLRPLSILPPVEGKKPAKDALTEDWHAKGWDYKANFTLNICDPVVKTAEDAVGIDKNMWKNISAHYTLDGKTYSMGSNESELDLRGRRLVLQYKNGSPCGPKDSKRKKSTIISFHCDKDALSTLSSTTVSFVGVCPDECSYHFEVLSPAACLAPEPLKQGVGPAAVFTIIGVIAIMVYFLGGVFYQRNVAHARGWRQLPNYSMWAGIGSFIKVSLYTIVSGVINLFSPKVASVRDVRGILPTMEIGGHRRKASRGEGLYPSRSSWS